MNCHVFLAAPARRKPDVPDSFHVDADSMQVISGGYDLRDHMAGRDDLAGQKAQESYEAAMEAIRNAVEGDGKVEGTLSKEDHQAYRDSLPPIPGLGEPDGDAKLYTSQAETEEEKAAREAAEAQTQAAREAAAEKRQEAIQNRDAAPEEKEKLRREMLGRLSDMLKRLKTGGSEALAQLLAAQR